MLNVTSEATGVGAGVLLRALEPLEGIDRMERFRGGAGLLDLARGPGRLAQAMQIDFRQDGLDLCAAGPLWLATSRRKTAAIGKSVRIGLTRNVVSKLRFYELGNPYVSGPKRLRQRLDGHRSTSTSPDGVEQQINTFPAAGGSNGSG